MKVFLSWSGELSMRIAEVLRDWLPSTLQSVRPFFTPNDIEKGARWASEIASELRQSKLGIFVITKENIEKAWIMFEAGAISREMDTSKICVVLFGVDTTDLTGPLTQFQATRFDKSDFRKLLNNINESLGENSLKASVIDAVFEKWWPDLEEKIRSVQKEYNLRKKPSEVRDQRDMIEEVLITSRAILKEVNVKNQPVRQPPPQPIRYAGSTYELIMDYYKKTLLECQFSKNNLDAILPILKDLINEIESRRLVDSLKAPLIGALEEVNRTLTGELKGKTAYDLDDDIPF